MSIVNELIKLTNNLTETLQHESHFLQTRQFLSYRASVPLKESLIAHLQEQWTQLQESPPLTEAEKAALITASQALEIVANQHQKEVSAALEVNINALNFLRQSVQKNHQTLQSYTMGPAFVKAAGIPQSTRTMGAACNSLSVWMDQQC